MAEDFPSQLRQDARKVGERHPVIAGSMRAAADHIDNLETDTAHVRTTMRQLHRPVGHTRDIGPDDAEHNDYYPNCAHTTGRGHCLGHTRTNPVCEHCRTPWPCQTTLVFRTATTPIDQET